MDYATRPARPEDGPALTAITLAAIRETARAAYSPEQVEAWSARVAQSARIAGAFAGDFVRVAVDQADSPVAYFVLEADGHLDMLYCHPDHGGRGLGRRLLAEAELAARALDLTRLLTEASELARPVFARAGYTLLHRRNFTIPHEGREVAIHNYAMEKRLA
ncbi:GNAT family N-acetyltransferase [Erythrobacter oryzae]|uniref:GNAT family N-acetyltransferase n=1 Tax=Erythrobacter oryzae TaxID=3019556 RepID=UPI002553C622|nr:GNAT family N-acetyltransferase [Erythrobacter sp. COR-2]